MVAPVGIADILTAVSAIFVDPEAEPLGRSLAFIGAKGGCGSSVIAHNCAWGISNLFSTETILADLDLPYGTANIDFDQDPPQGIAEAVFAPERLDEVFLDRLLTKCSEHLSLLAAPSMLDAPMISRPAPFIRFSKSSSVAPRFRCSTFRMPGQTGPARSSAKPTKS